jgi:hypothetical protein
MNLNNKFGECCSCPALYDHRILTSYVPRRDYNASVMKEMNVTNGIDYRVALQQNGSSILTAMTVTNEKQYVCKGEQFYRVVDIDGYFNTKLAEELAKPSTL